MIDPIDCSFLSLCFVLCLLWCSMLLSVDIRFFLMRLSSVFLPDFQVIFVSVSVLFCEFELLMHAVWALFRK